jgi:energy-coupling factor transporter ATP-binding protein EcfA2
MLNSIHVQNLTVFVDAKINFSPQLNVIIGENGVGKSHLLKIPYAILAASAEEGRKPNAAPPTKSGFQTKLADKLVHVLRPEKLGRLARRRQGHSRCEITCKFSPASLALQFGFTTTSQSSVSFDKGKLPASWVEKSPVFLPTRELLTIYPGFVSLYENRFLEFEESWRDTCSLLGSPTLRGAKEKTMQDLLSPLEQAMGGRVELDSHTGRFYLNIPSSGRMEMPLVAEGLRKFAMVARLIATGSLANKSYLFWDEPESNLNPLLVKQMAKTIFHLCTTGIQVFVATHSLFLLREFEILRKNPEFNIVKTRFIGLVNGSDGVEVEQGDSIDSLETIVSLTEELNQTMRYLESENNS